MTATRGVACYRLNSASCILQTTSLPPDTRGTATMNLRRRSVLLRVALLVLVPLIFLLGLFTYTVTTSVSGALTLIRSKDVMDDLAPPVASLQQALTRERAQIIVYGGQPTPAAQAALQRPQPPTHPAPPTSTPPAPP